MLHVVRAGECLHSIAALYDCDAADLIGHNPHRSWSLLDPLLAGQAVHVPSGLIGKPYVPPPSELASRPPVDSQPDVIAAWLKASGFSPVWAYPEMGWYQPNDPAHPETAWRADYDLVAPGQLPGTTQGHVWWWVQNDGSWDYDHQWGTSIGKSLEQIANAVGSVASAFGIAGASQFVYTLHAAAGNGSPAEMAAALRMDWDSFQSSADLAQAVKSGDWAKVWNQVTKSGTELAQLQNAFAPGPAPDVHGNLTIPPGNATGCTVPAGSAPNICSWLGALTSKARPAPPPPPPGTLATSSTSTAASVAVGLGLAGGVAAAIWAGLGHKFTIAAVKAVFGQAWKHRNE